MSFNFQPVTVDTQRTNSRCGYGSASRENVFLGYRVVVVIKYWMLDEEDDVDCRSKMDGTNAGYYRLEPRKS